jgi:tetratricopeptide (TPR) repeat protein
MRTRGFRFRSPALYGFALSGLLALAAPLPAAAASGENAFKACIAEDTLLAERLKQCNAVIASRKFKGQKLALALTYRGVVHGKQKNFTKAIADFDEALRHHPDSPRAYWYRGSTWAAANDFDRALADLDKAIKLAPESAALRRTRAYVYSERKEHARASDDLTIAVGLAPRPHVEYTLRALAHLDAGERDKAIADYRKALEIDPGYDPPREGLRSLGAASVEALQLPPGKCSENNISDEERVAGCTAAIESGKLAAGPLTIAYCNLGYSLTELGQYVRVFETSVAAIRIDANSACAYLNRGRAWYYKKDSDRAIADYTQTIRLDRTFHEAYASRGTAYHERRDFARAIADYDAAISIDPAFAPYRSDRGNTRFQMGDSKRAIVDLTRAIEIDPNLAAAYARRGHAFLAIDDLDRAEADFAKALELAPGDAHASSGRAQVYKRRGKPEPAADRENTTGLNFEKFRRLMQPNGAASAN